MMDIEEKRETGGSLIVLGLGFWLMDLLVIFFLPSGIRYGHRSDFLGIIFALGALGLALIVIGYKVRGYRSPGEIRTEVSTQVSSKAQR
jgi:hypothetical protein